MKLVEKWCSKCSATTEHKMSNKLLVCLKCSTLEIIKAKPKFEIGPGKKRRRLYGNIKLSEKQVEEILLKRANGIHAADLAKEYGVTTQTIYDRTRNYNMVNVSKELLLRWIDERIEERMGKK